MNYSNRELPLLAEIQPPTLLSSGQIGECKAYRDAVRLCWLQRRRQRLTKSQLAEETGCYAPHVTDYIHESKTRRELPAQHIAAFEESCGNRVITQWLVAQSGLHIAEEMMQRMAA